MKLIISALFFLATCFENLNSQPFNHPNIGLKSHETLEISKIEITSQNTLIFLSVENRIADGYFCADKNIFILYPDGTRIVKLSIPNTLEKGKYALAAILDYGHRQPLGGTQMMLDVK